MKKVCVQGMGFVGAAMATSIAMVRKENKPIYEVFGIDLSDDIGKERIKKLNEGNFPFNTSDESLKAAVQLNFHEKNFHATSDINHYADAEVIVVDIPLNISYLEEDPQLDFSSFLNSLESIAEKIQGGCLLLIETTVPPGTCEKVVVPFLETELGKRNMKLDDIFLAHSYERVMPGDDYLASIREYWRVFSGYNKKSSIECKKFLETIIDSENYPLTELESMTASETAKVMENTYRAVNIAFIDEWTKFADSSNLDLIKIIEAIKIRPTHSNLMLPGLGVGGYCLTKDPTFAPAASKQIFNNNIEFPFSKLAVQVNNNMPLHAIEILKLNSKKEINNSNILICGVSYRPNVSDTRYSASEILVRKLLEEGANISLHDPHVPTWQELSMKVDNFSCPSSHYDAIIMCVAHQEYRLIDLEAWFGSSKLILDSNNVFTESQRESLKNLEFPVHYIGRK